MFKKFILLLIFCISIHLRAQDKTNTPVFGVHMGYALLDLNSNIFEGDTQSGFFLGASIDFKITERILLSPKVLYANYGDVGFIHIPIFLSYEINKSIYILGGPQLTILLDDPFNLNKELGMDIGAGLGYNISEKIYLEARYALALTNRIKDSVDFDREVFSEEPTSKYNNFMLGIGYRF